MDSKRGFRRNIIVHFFGPTVLHNDNEYEDDRLNLFNAAQQQFESDARKLARLIPDVGVV